jgi:hypothetical protein
MTVSLASGTPLKTDLPNFIDLVLNFSPVLDSANANIDFSTAEIDF